MKVTTLDEKSIHDIGHAFGYYDYGEETGMSAAFSGKDATANYICAYVCGVLRGGFLHTTSQRGEGYIAYKLPMERNRAEKLPAESSCSKRMKEQISIKRQFVSSIVPLK